MSDSFSPERVADRMVIEEVLLRWCRAIDRLDLDGIRGVFHEDAIDNHGQLFDVEGLVAWVRDRHRTISVSMHRVSNILIEFAGPDLALVESYADVFQCYPPGAQGALAQLTGDREASPDVGKVLLAPGRYIDRFERRAGRWKIAARTVVFESSLVLDLPKPPEGGPDWVRGRRDSDDALFAQRRSLGIGECLRNDSSHAGKDQFRRRY